MGGDSADGTGIDGHGIVHDILDICRPGSHLSARRVLRCALVRADAVLNEADLSRSSFVGCSFARAQLRKTNFAFSDLKGATFVDAIGLYETFFLHAINVEQATFPPGFRPKVN